MNKYIFIFSVIVFSACPSEEIVVSYDKINERNGIYYLINISKPFSGISEFRHNSSSEVSARYTYKDGKIIKLETFYKNGQIADRSNFKDGKLHGEHIVWHTNGQKRVVEKFRDGKYVEGSATVWDEEGNEVK